MNTLERLNEFTEALSQVSKMKEKEEILKSHDHVDLRKILQYTYNKMDTFGVTSKVVKAKGAELSEADLQWTHYETIYNLLDALVARDITGNTAIAHVWKFAEDSGYQDLVYRVIDRNLKCGASTSMMNKLYDNLVPKFDVALADDYWKVADSKKPKFDEDKWIFMRKLDGCRCIAMLKNGVVRFWSRGEKEFATLGQVKTEIEKLAKEQGIDNMVFDGEICIVDDKGNEDFQSIMKVIKKKDYTIERPMFKVFDMITVEEFYAKYAETDYETRNANLGTVMFSEDRSYLNWEKPLGYITSNEELEAELDKAEALGWEGIMVRKGPYEGKRSKSLLKVKKFHDAEYELEGYETATIQFMKYRAEDGTEYIEPADIPYEDYDTENEEFTGQASETVRRRGRKRIATTKVKSEQEMIKSARFTHKGSTVHVGSGWSIKDRIYYFEHPEELIGQIATIKYFEETKDQNGNHSLRFPVLKALHGKKRDV